MRLSTEDAGGFASLETLVENNLEFRMVFWTQGGKLRFARLCLYANGQTNGLPRVVTTGRRRPFFERHCVQSLEARDSELIRVELCLPALKSLSVSFIF